MAHDLAGLRIRAERKARRLTQADLAKRAGISASYLNLIEMNKRPLAETMLGKLADGLGMDRQALDGEAERRVAADLGQIAADPAFSDGSSFPETVEELVGRQPRWAALILRLYRAYLDERQAVLALADRLNRDPFLGDSVHRMLTNVTAIRSAAQILQSLSDAGGNGGLADANRDRFLSIVVSDSEKLARTAQSIVAFFDNANMRIRSATPMEHVDAFIFETGNHFPRLEEVASAFLAERREIVPENAAEYLATADGPAGTNRLEAPETRRFRAMRLSANELAADAIAEIIGDHPELESAEARELATSALVSYAAAAMLMPYELFLEAAETSRYDLDTLSRRFGVSYEQAAHRLATLRRPGAEGVRFAFMRSDPSGYVTKRLPLPRLPLPRYGNACPLWAIHGAFQTPGVTVRNFGELPSGERFLFFARAVEKGQPAANRPRHLLSIMLACPLDDARRVSAGDGIDQASATVPLGTVCRLCPRAQCGHRQEAPLIA